MSFQSFLPHNQSPTKNQTQTQISSKATKSIDPTTKQISSKANLSLQTPKSGKQNTAPPPNQTKTNKPKSLCLFAKQTQITFKEHEHHHHRLGHTIQTRHQIVVLVLLYLLYNFSKIAHVTVSYLCLYQCPCFLV